MSTPVIQTAIPKRRYQLGEFMISVLGDIESGDGIAYRYILAVARESDAAPNLFLSVEPNDGAAGEGAWALRVSMPDGSQVLGAADRWGEFETFTAEALAMVRKMLSLEDEEPYRLG